MANFKWYGLGALAVHKGTVDLDTDTFKVMLTTSAYTPNQDTHDFRDDVTNEITGTGYTAGGATLAGVSATYDAASNEVRILWTDASWGPSASFTARQAIIYKSRGGAASADELVAYLDFGADLTVTSSTFTLDFTTSVLKTTVA